MVHLTGAQSFKALVAASLLLSSVPALAQASPVLGSWETTATTPMGELKSTFTFSGTSGDYAVDIKDQPMAGGPGGAGDAAPEQTVSDLAIDGSMFFFKRTIKSPQGEFALSYSGTVSGDNLTAKAVSDFGDVDITGKRVR